MAGANTNVTTDFPSVQTTSANEHKVDLSIPNAVLSPGGLSSTNISNHSFEDSTTRLAFTQKVITLKFFQILKLMSCLMFFEQNEWWITRSILYNLVAYRVISVLLFVGTLVLLLVCKKAREHTILKHLFLMVYPTTLAFIVCVVMPVAIVDTIFITVICLSVVMAVLLFYTIFSIQTDMKFKQNMANLISGALFIVTILICSFSLYINILYSIFPLLIGFILCAYWLYDIDAMVSNDYHSPIKPSDYVLGTLNLHFDYIFVIKRLKKRFSAERNPGN